jgi:hypothetical protein
MNRRNLLPEWTSDIPSAGGMGNTVLYQMVDDYPDHSDASVVRDKLLVIGRVYAASPTRRAGQRADYNDSEKIELLSYLAQCLFEQRNELDSLISACRELGRVSGASVKQVIEAHAYLENLIVNGIRNWRGEKADVQNGKLVGSRSSFVSKYLHFHAPMAFFILDSIVEKRLMKYRVPRSRTPWPNDFPENLRNRYAKHCFWMLKHIEKSYGGINWDPRMVDAHLMGYQASIPLPNGLK